MLDMLCELRERVRQKRPLVHYIPNLVTGQFVADALLALGAIPVMALTPEDGAALNADVLVINLGTLDSAKTTTCLKLVEQAQARHQAWVLDPVGVASFPARRRLAQQLLKLAPTTIIRGNASEIAALAGQTSHAKGVESDLNIHHQSNLAHQAAQHWQTVIACTGKTDVISNGIQTLQVHNGHAWLAHISGAGCVASALVGAACAIHESPLEAATVALIWLGVAAEQAAKHAAGLGSFRVALLDHLFHQQTHDLEQHARWS